MITKVETIVTAALEGRAQQLDVPRMVHEMHSVGGDGHWTICPWLEAGVRVREGVSRWP